MQKVFRYIVVSAALVVMVLGIPIIFPAQFRAETDQGDQNQAAEELDA